MSTDKIQALVKNMAPQDAASAIAIVIKGLFPLLDEDTRIKFVIDLIGDSDDDKVSSLVHL
jgi:hypothetical protein